MTFICPYCKLKVEKKPKKLICYNCRWYYESNKDREDDAELIRKWKDKKQ